MFAIGTRIRLLRRVLAAAALILWLESWLSGQAAAAAGSASPGEPVEQFRQAAESVYRSVGEGDPLGVLRKVREAEEALAALQAAGLPSSDVVRALSDSMERMRRAVTALSPDEKEVYIASASLRLAADAISPKGQGLWLDYRRLMREDAAELAASLPGARGGTSQAALDRLATLTGHYELVRTAAAVTGRSASVDRADAVFRYAKRVLADSPPNPSLTAPLAAQIRATVDELFPSASEAPASVPLAPAPPVGLFSVIGAFILTVLTYSGWRKYRDEQRK